MACQPSSTFLLVASSTSKAGTICPPGMASILIAPCVSLSTRSPNILKCSCSVLLAGQLDCILRVFVAGACALAAMVNAAATRPAAMVHFCILKSSRVDRPKLRRASRRCQRNYHCAMRVALFLCLALMSCLAAAQNVRFVVGFTPGGSSDILARALAAKLAESLGHPVVVDNRPGAGGNLAAELVAKSAPDGNTWLLGNNAILATNHALYSRLGYDPLKDFAPVALVAIQPNILVVHPSVPAHSVAELIAYAKQHPGKLNYAST